MLTLAIRRKSYDEIVKWRIIYPDPQRLEDISSIRDAMRQICQEASVAVGLLDVKIEDECLDGWAEAGKVRTGLELIQSLSIEVSEELYAYQSKYARYLNRCSCVLPNVQNAIAIIMEGILNKSLRGARVSLPS